MRAIIYLLIFTSFSATASLKATQTEKRQQDLNLIEFNVQASQEKDFFCRKIYNPYVEYKTHDGQTVELLEAHTLNKRILRNTTSSFIQENIDPLLELTSIIEEDLFPYFQDESILFDCEPLKSRINNLYVISKYSSHYKLSSIQIDISKKTAGETKTYNYNNFTANDKLFTSNISNAFYRVSDNQIYSVKVETKRINETLLYSGVQNERVIGLNNYDKHKFAILSYINDGPIQKRKHFLKVSLVDLSIQAAPIFSNKMEILGEVFGISDFMRLPTEYYDYAKTKTEQLLSNEIQSFLNSFIVKYDFNNSHQKLDILVQHRSPIFRTIGNHKWNEKEDRWEGYQIVGMNLKASPNKRTKFFSIDTDKQIMLSSSDLGPNSINLLNHPSFIDPLVGDATSNKQNQFKVNNDGITYRFEGKASFRQKIQSPILIFSDSISPLPKEDIDSYYGGSTKLINAIKSNSTNSYKDALNLISNQAKVNLKDFLGKSPLHYAVTKSNNDKLKLLLANLADPNAIDRNGNTPAHLILIIKYLSGSYSGLSGDQKDIEIERTVEALKLLKEQGADFTRINKNGVSVNDLINDPSVPKLVRDGVK